jgi:hypothetical protein
VKRCELANIDSPQPPSLSDMDKYETEAFLQEMLFVYPLIRMNIFSKLSFCKQRKRE